MALDRRTLLKATVLGVGGLAAGTAAPPPTPSLGPDLDGYAPYEPQTQCFDVAQPGVVAFRTLILRAYPGTRDLGILRACTIGGTSEHKDGRAWDWGVLASRPAEAAAAQSAIDWLLATDRHGYRHAMARRLGLMYLIWNRRTWRARQPDAWQTYQRENPHTDHVHFAFGWAGARKQTSYWGAPPRIERPWSAWTSTATRIAGAPAATSWSDGKIDVFATSSGGTLLHRWMVDGQGWGPGDGWRDLGAPHGIRLTSHPATAARAEGRLDVVAVGSDHALWHRSYRAPVGWSGWVSLGGHCRSAPGAASWGADHLIVATLGSAGTVWERSYGGRWLPWRRIPGAVFTTAPALAGWARGRIDVVGRGTAGDLVHHVYLTGHGWSGPMSRGGVVADATPAAISLHAGRLDVFVIAGNEAIYRTWWETRWRPAPRGWDHFGKPGGGAVAGLGTASLDAARLEVLACGRDGRLHRRWYT